MQLHDLQPAAGSTHRRKVVGRGPGSGHGKNSTRGDKGNKKRGQVSPTFEGGQTPLHRRLPQLRGFRSVNRVEYAVINLRDLEAFEDGSDVTPAALAERGLLRHADERVKILDDGTLTKKLTVRAHKFSKSAAEKLQTLGGAAETIA